MKIFFYFITTTSNWLCKSNKTMCWSLFFDENQYFCVLPIWLYWRPCVIFNGIWICVGFIISFVLFIHCNTFISSICNFYIKININSSLHLCFHSLVKGKAYDHIENWSCKMLLNVVDRRLGSPHILHLLVHHSCWSSRMTCQTCPFCNHAIMLMAKEGRWQWQGLWEQWLLKRLRNDDDKEEVSWQERGGLSWFVALSYRCSFEPLT